MKRIQEKVKDVVEVRPYTNLQDFISDPVETLDPMTRCSGWSHNEPFPLASAANAGSAAFASGEETRISDGSFVVLTSEFTGCSPCLDATPQPLKNKTAGKNKANNRRFLIKKFMESDRLFFY